MKNVSEVSRLSGVSVRTLHHYDHIGLLRPSEVTDAGYRLYDEEAISRLFTILLFRELRFPLSEIKQILDTENYDKKKSLEGQIELLELEKERLEGIIAHARRLLKGEEPVNFDMFDEKKLNDYKKEAREKWGNTHEYAESEKKTKDKSDKELFAAGEELMAIFGDLGRMKELDPSSEEVQKKTEEIKNFITKNYYTCTNEIFFGLGQMYVYDERFRENIDNAGGEGTAEFVKKAITIYCGK